MNSRFKTSNPRIEIYGVERAARGEWWDLFCSKECVQKIYGDVADATYLYDCETFNRETGAIFERKEWQCFACDARLAPAVRQEMLQRIEVLKKENEQLYAIAKARGLVEDEADA